MLIYYIKHDIKRNWMKMVWTNDKYANFCLIKLLVFSNISHNILFILLYLEAANGP